MSAPGVAGVELVAGGGCAALDDPVMGSATFLNEIAGRHPDALSLAAGRPHARFLSGLRPAELLEEYTRHLEARPGADPDGVTRDLTQYGRTAGLIHDLVAHSLALDSGITVDPGVIVVVDGAQEGMLVTLRALCSEPGDVLLVGAPCYIGMLGTARLLGVEVVGVPERADGLAADDVAAAAQRVRRAGGRPRALYLVPTFSNPSGTTLSLPARHALLEVAQRERLIVLEDDPYSFLAAPGTHLPALKALPGGDRVVYIGTFSKTCFPGTRVGYVVADQPVRTAQGKRVRLADQLALIRSMTTVNTAPMAQGVVAAMLLRAGGSLVRANREAARFYRDNMTLLLRSLDAAFPGPDRHGVCWNRPSGGFFAVLTVPIPADEDLLARSAARYGVLWTPMSWFHPDGTGGRRQIRLSCSALDPDDIPEAVVRLAALVQERTCRPGPGALSGTRRGRRT